MKINTNSWHYRFNGMSGDNLPKTVCGYFWMTMVHLCLAGVGLFCAGFVGLFLLSPLLQFVTHVRMITDSVNLALWMEGVILTLTIVGLFFNKSSFGRVVWEYVKGIKNKFCPLIEYGDDK